jgi:hypothetical protein
MEKIWSPYLNGTNGSVEKYLTVWIVVIAPMQEQTLG